MESSEFSRLIVSMMHGCVVTLKYFRSADCDAIDWNWVVDGHTLSVGNMKCDLIAGGGANAATSRRHFGRDDDGGGGNQLRQESRPQGLQDDGSISQGHC